MISLRSELEALEGAADAVADRLGELDALHRVFAGDHTLFQESPDECANRFGWISAPGVGREGWDSLVECVAPIRAGNEHVLVMGMGGSSLFPMVLADVFGPQADAPELHVLDSTHPDQIARVLAECPAESTFHLASSKSGTTIETRSHLELCWERNPDPTRFGVVTDPGSELERWATDRGIENIFLADPDVGGRFSAFTAFGLTPAAIAGVDGAALLDAGLDAWDAVEPGDDPGESSAFNVAVRLAAVMAAGVDTGRDQLTFLLEDRLAPFALWLEQLIAESSGKHGTGVIPMVGEARPDVMATLERRVLVAIGDVPDLEELRGSGAPLVELSCDEAADLGGHVLLWEVATALACAALGVNAFDQPDVESAKIAARAVLAGDTADSVPSEGFDAVLAAAADARLVVVCGFVDEATSAPSLEELAARVRAEAARPVVVEIGPRFLHSTGQLHKGGPAGIVVVQVVTPPTDDLAIPGSANTFGELLAAQADGDAAALAAAGRRVIRLDPAALG